MDSFATCNVVRGSSRSSGKLQLMPYFGHFSGMWITFDVRRKLDCAGNYKVKVKIEGYQNPSQYLFLRCEDKKSRGITNLAGQTSLKELCLKYVHKSEYPNLEINHQPSKLVFLCEKKIILNLDVLNSSVLPVSFSHLNPKTFSTQDLFIKMWYGSSKFPANMERITVRKGLSISELKWMLSCKVPLPTVPSDLELYEYDSTEKLSDHSYVTPEQLTFHCIVLSSLERDSVIVSLIGQGIEQIKVKPSMTLNQFQAKVKEKFSLKASSFIYFPSVCRSKNVLHYNEVMMSALLDKSTLSLISSRRRNLPIIDGIPLGMLKYDQLEMYKLTMSELNLASNLVRAYEVEGPTVPISFRTATSVVGKREFVLIADRPHAISINLSWSVQILLKYIEEICHFPCESIAYEGSILPYNALLHQYFTKDHWNISDSPKVS